MLILSAADLDKAVERPALMEQMAQALVLQEKGGFFMPPRPHFEHGGNTLLVMPCFAQASLGVKLVTVCPDNLSRGLPAIHGLMLLSEADTGRPLALMHGGRLTALRTGAVGGVAVDTLAPAGVKSLGLVGAGVQGREQVLMAVAARPEIQRVVVHDRDAGQVEDFLADLADYLPGRELIPAQGAADMLQKSQVVVTATTSPQPVLPEDPALLAGKTYVAVGSYKPEMRELPQALYGLLERVWLDTGHARDESGDVKVPLDKGWLGSGQVDTLGALLANGGKPGGPTRLFKMVGMALLDVMAAAWLYQRAQTLGLGTQVEL